MAGPAKDPILEGLKAAYGEDGVEKIAHAARAMSASVPRLSEAELKQIAEQVAASIIERNLHAVPDQERARWRARIADISYQLALGVAGSGLYAVLAYLANLGGLTFASRDGTSSADDPARQAARTKLLRAVPEAERKTVEELLSFPMLPSLVGVQLERQLGQDQGFKELSAYVADQEQPRSAASRSWWSRAAASLSPKSATQGTERSSGNDIRQGQLLQSITRQVFFAVTRKVSERLEKA